LRGPRGRGRTPGKKRLERGGMGTLCQGREVLSFLGDVEAIMYVEILKYQKKKVMGGNHTQGGGGRGRYSPLRETIWTRNQEDLVLRRKREEVREGERRGKQPKKRSSDNLLTVPDTY